jgi:hypothetical protein
LPDVRILSIFRAAGGLENLPNSADSMQEPLDSADQLSKIPIIELLTVEMLFAHALTSSTEKSGLTLGVFLSF